MTMPTILSFKLFSKYAVVLLGCLLGCGVTHVHAMSEAEAIDALQAAKARVRERNGEVFSVALPKRAGDELVSLLQYLPSLRSVGAVGNKASAQTWTVLHKLPHLESVNLWDSHSIDDYSFLQGLPLERLLMGGAMGLKGTDGEADAILAVKDLPNLRRLLFAHRPHVRNREHLMHLITTFPDLVELRVDFWGVDSEVTPEVFDEIRALKHLEALTIEGAKLYPEFLNTIAAMPTIKRLDLRLNGNRSLEQDGHIAAFQAARPDVEVRVE